MQDAGTGTLLADRYQLEGKIACGSGQAWRARDLARGRQVVVRLPQASSAPRMAEFLSAARRAAMLSHPGIVRILDYGGIDGGGGEGGPFLVTELAAETSLGIVMLAGRLDPWWVLDLIRQVSSALEAAHAAGLLHQDLQPANLLLAPGGTIKMPGFWMPAGAGAPHAPACYVAPELAEGATATPASDLYALGAVAWECLTGLTPSPSPARLPATISAGVAHLVMDLVAEDPGARPSSAAAAAARSRELLHSPMRKGA